MAAYLILIWAHHAGAELMENLEGGRVVTGEAPFPLKRHGRHAWRLTGHPIGSPEPDLQRRRRTCHHPSHRQSCVSPAGAASKDTGTTWTAQGIAHRRARRADESREPTPFQQGTGAGVVIREKPLERWKRVRERKIVALMNVHEHGADIIRSIMEGNNRIGMIQSSKPIERFIRPSLSIAFMKKES